MRNDVKDNEPLMLTSPVDHYDENPKDPTFKLFRYCWLNISTGTTGETEIWFRNRKDFLETLNFWNRAKDWKYAEFFSLTKG